MPERRAVTLYAEENSVVHQSIHRVLRFACAVAVTAGLLAVSAPMGRAASIGDADYREGFGKDATGGAGHAIYVVTSSAATGPGSFTAAFPSDGPLSDVTIVFAVPSFTVPGPLFLGINVTIDGMANGMNGVTMDATADIERGLVIEDPASNIVIRGINFRSTGTPNSGATEFDLLTIDGTNGQSISNVFIDRCTFMQASDGTVDITGNVSNVTVQRSLFYGNAITM